MLGYDVDPRGGKLVVNEAEAAQVRKMFRFYEKDHSVATVLEEVQRRRWKTKSWITKRGSKRAGNPFSKATLLRLLTNAIYIGKVEHKGTIYPGEQAAIVEPDVWETVNTELRKSRRGKNGVTRSPQNALLTGLLFCKSCSQPMMPTYTLKGDRRYHYYVCRSAREKDKGRNVCPTKSVAARMIDESVISQVMAALRTEDIREKLEIPAPDWEAFGERSSGDFVRTIVQRVVYDGASGKVSLELGAK